MTEPDPPLPGLGLTALLVAGARARERARAAPLFDDPFAQVFVDAASAGSPALAQALRQGSGDPAIDQARRDAVAVRTRFCDASLLAATEAGCRQVVLLAAGLDARAFRLAWPSGLRLWELDVPAVFAWKEPVLAAQGALPACERRVLPVDLRQDWPAALRGAGFDPAAPSAWLIEGLLMYLDEEERDRLLSGVSALAAAGSRLTLDHAAGFLARPALESPEDPQGAAAAERLAALAARAASDPSLAEPAGWLARHGWRADVHDAHDLQARHGRPGRPGGPRRWLARCERQGRP